MGSKPNGIVKVCSEMDPFRSGGPAGPVRRKFPGVVVQGGLTVALRPIKQNPQIAGVVIDGYSYSNALLEDLPTAPGAPGDQPDFSVLSRITAQPPADPSLLYDPSFNPKFKTEFKSSSSGTSSYAQNQPTSLSQSASGTRPSSTYGFSGGSSTLFSSTPATSAVQVPSYGYPAVGISSQPAGGNSARPASQAPPTPQMASPFGGAPVQAPSGAQGQNPISPPSAFNVRPTTYYRRRLASFQQEGTHADPGIISQYENLKPRAVQEQIAVNSGPGSQVPSMGVQTTQGQDNSFLSPSSSHGAQHAPYVSNAFDKSEATSAYSSATNHALYGVRGNTQMAAGNPDAEAYRNQQSSQDYNPPPQVASNNDIAQRVYQAQSETLQMNANPVEGFVDNGRASLQPNRVESSPTSSQQFSSSGVALSRNNFPPAPGVNPGSTNAAHLHGSGNTVASPMQPMTLDQKEMTPNRFSDNPTSFSGGQSNFGPSVDQTSSEAAVRDSPTSSYSQTYDVTDTALRPDQLNRMPSGAKTSASNYARPAQEPTTPSLMGSQFDNEASPIGELYSSRMSNGEPVSNRPLNAEATGRTLGDFSSVAMSEQLNTGPMPGTESLPRSRFASPNMDTAQAGTSNSRLESVDGLRIVSRTGVEMPADRRRVGRMVSGMRRDGANEIGYGNEARPQGQNTPDIPGLPPVPGLPDIPSMTGGEEGREDTEQREAPSVGVHNGMSGLDGMCINNSTHCSCGMAERAQMPPEECLFVVNEHTTPMICAKRTCSGRLVCACAIGANTLCRRSYVKSILVPTQVHRHDTVEESDVVFCRREMVEEGVPVLSPII